MPHSDLRNKLTARASKPALSSIATPFGKTILGVAAHDGMGAAAANETNRLNVDVLERGFGVSSIFLCQ